MKHYAPPEKLAIIKENFSDATFDEAERQPALYVSGDKLLDLLKFLRDDERMMYGRLENVTSVDWKTYFVMVYNLFSWENYEDITVKVKLDHEKPVVSSVTAVFPGVEFEEREVFDLMGIEFKDHPDLRRILLADDFEGHPLRKDYQQIMPPRVRHLVKGE